MTAAVHQIWTERVRQTLPRYDAGLLRLVAGNLCRPRNQWPLDELIDRSLGIITNPAVLDRRLKDLSTPCRRLLAMIGHSGQPVWRVGNLIELSMAVGETDGLAPVISLLESGLLYPALSDGDQARKGPRLKTFPVWLAQAPADATWVFAHPAVCRRAIGVDLGLPECPGPAAAATGAAVREADGLEWPLRMAVVWQQLTTASLRRTQQGDFFKRDLERLRTDGLLTPGPADSPRDIPDPGLLAVALALRVGIVRQQDTELIAGEFPQSWPRGLPATLLELWSALPHLGTWNTDTGHQSEAGPGNPYPSAYLLCLLLLSRLPDDAWAEPAKIGAWIRDHHPYWTSGTPSDAKGLEVFLLGLAYSLGMVQATKEADGWLVRLSALGRWILGLSETAPGVPAFPQTLLVQPNHEILAYRQGLTPELIARLSRFAAWKTLGSACTLQLQPETVYRALEAGESFDSIVGLLDGRGMKPTPASVLEALRTWSNKRDRIQVYPSASLLEFGNAADLQEALSRGLPAVRLTDRLAVVADEGDIDFSHYRLTGTRDYCSPPEKCVTVEPDGVTLSIDQSRSDLLLETELQRFAEPVPRVGSNGKVQYRLTPTSLVTGRQSGTTLESLDAWYGQRCGQSTPAAVHLLLAGAELSPPELRRQLVLTVAHPVIADGLQQWPDTANLIRARLGPTALLVNEDRVAELQEKLRSLGIRMAPL